MKAVAVLPGQPNSVHLREVAKPAADAAGERSVLVKVLQVGLDGTDREIISALYGKPPPGDDYLIFGHESLGVVEAVGPGVIELSPGDTAGLLQRGGNLHERRRVIKAADSPRGRPGES